MLSRLGRKAERNSRERPIPPTRIDEFVSEPGGLFKALPAPLALRAVQDEWAARLEDIVERRLMLHFSPHLSRQMLTDLADGLVQQGRLAANDVATAIGRCERRLHEHFGIKLAPPDS